MSRGALVWAALALAALACSGVLEARPAAVPAPEEPAAEAPAEEEPLPAPAEGEPPPTPTAVNPLTPVVTETRWLSLDMPLELRTGLSETFILRLDVEGPAVTPTASLEGHVVEGEALELPDVYETHDVLALASLRAAGLQVEPRGEVAEPLLPGQPVVFRWSVSADRPGRHVVTVALRLRFTPKAGGQAVERTYWARDLTVEARDVAGLPARTAAWLGSLGSLLGTVLGFPYLREVVDWLRRRRTRGMG